MVVDSAMVGDVAKREGVDVVSIPATEIAEEAA